MCDRVLTDSTITRDKAQLRAVALQMLGEAYVNVKKEVSNSSNPAVAGGATGTGGGGGGVGDDTEYVRIDTKGSRAKEGR